MTYGYENNLALFSCARALCKKCNADEKTKSKIIMALFTDYSIYLLIETLGRL